MTEDEFKKEMEELMCPEGWENCLEEVENFIFGVSNLADRYKKRELVAALAYLGRSLRWHVENPEAETPWLGSHEWEAAMHISQGYVDAGENQNEETKNGN